jgi:nickel/cobalt transporter (NicO) family protein
MLEILISSIILSAIHATIPNHWVPIIAIGKAEKWNQKQTLFATVFSGFAHTLSTIFIGIMVGFAGYKLSEKFTSVSHQLAPLILIVLGLVYIIMDRQKNRHHSHNHDEIVLKNKTSWSILFSLSLSMFLTPCVEIEAYYFKAGIMGWEGIFLVSAVYSITTVILMVLLVYTGFKGIQRLRSHYLEHHEKLITGGVLVALGFFSFFINL